MPLLLLGLGVLIGSGVVALLAAPRWAARVGACGTVVGCALALAPVLGVAAGAPLESLRVAWPVPYGAFFIEIDALSAFFLLPILGLSAVVAVYGAEYLGADRADRRVGSAWLFFNLLVASMVMVVVARNAVLFLMAWELMALASFFLVTYEDETPGVREAGWMYLVAAHLGTACILTLFVLLGHGSGSLDFTAFDATAAPAGLLFVLAVIGFGTKAGLVPFHVWLPEAHPAAPSHVSAVMSAVMIKTGIYGIVRILTFLGPAPIWWGWLLCGVGLTSAIFGVLFALAQRDIKRLLAYSSVENVGIITLGLGVGVLGVSVGSAPVAVLGFAGAFLHVVVHALCKGLLFLAAGAAAHAVHTREIDRLGGLLKHLPWTGGAFLIGAVAISGLPPLSVFVSEFLIYLAALRGIVAGGAATAVPLLCVVAGLALSGGLAAACFSSAFGIAFLGAARSEQAARAREPGLAMRAPMLLLAASCLLIGCTAPLVVAVLTPVVERASGLPAAVVHDVMAGVRGPLTFVGAAGLGVLLVTALVAVVRRRLLAPRAVAQSGTWDCGYARPSPRMQYTTGSFAQPLTEFFAPLLRSRRHLDPPRGLFPSQASLTIETPDVCVRGFFAPLFAAVGRGLLALRWLQHGRVHLYVLYIALTLLVLLVWKLG